ncbi:hypothetical protein BY996DRAFT_8684027 [Phakopsora pachyrhizi]|nr:hypothetical protein BY996DRAFT_8684027 [Phakopsora pachyrhizi]
MEGKGAYFSPYNRNLLNFLDSNLENILTGELNEYIITNDFFQTIKTTFWDENKGIFLVSEKKIKDAISFVDSKSYGANGKRWVEYSGKGLKSFKKLPATSRFCFRKVFTNLLTYDKLSRFILTEKMRQRGKLHFEQLNSKLVKLAAIDKNVNKAVIDHTLRRIWTRMTSFLAYVHAINATISSGPLKPLEYDQLVKYQEDALDFYFSLHNKVEDLCKKININAGSY